MKGTVKFFNGDKEFGFIAGEDGKEYFVHKTGLEAGVTIDKDDSVTFDAEKGDKGAVLVGIDEGKIDSLAADPGRRRHSRRSRWADGIDPDAVARELDGPGVRH